MQGQDTDEGEIRYVCNLDETPAIAAALKDLRDFNKRDEEQKEFMKKRLDALKEERAQKWEALFEAAKSANKIPQEYKYTDWGIHLGDNFRQMFIQKVDKTPKGLGDVLKTLFT